VNAGDRKHRLWCAIGSVVAQATLLALFGGALLAVAFVTRFLVGADVT
jgi:hypothetical protein